MKEGKGWLVAESKPLDISIELVKGKFIGTVLERSRDFSKWIRFRERSLVGLLVRVEDCCQKVAGKPFKEWKKGETSYRLDLQSNVAGRFILCSICFVESKRLMVFPEGKGYPGV